MARLRKRRAHKERTGRWPDPQPAKKRKRIPPPPPPPKPIDPLTIVATDEALARQERLRRIARGEDV